MIYGWVTNSKKKMWLWCAFVYVVMVPLTSQTYVDYPAYSKTYEAIGNSRSIDNLEVSIGWFFLNKLFYFIGFSYRGFVAVMIVLCFYLLHKILSCYNTNENIFWSLFLAFPALIQCAQLRFFVGSTIGIVGFRYLAEGGKKSIIKFIALVMAATLIHSAMLMLLIYMIIPIFRRFYKNKAFMLSAVLIALTYFSLNTISKIASIVVPPMRYARYFGQYTEEASVSRFIYITIIWLLSFVISYKFKKNYTLQNIKLQTDVINENTKTINNYYLAIAITGMTIPFMTIDASFHRFFEISYVYLYIIVSIVWRRKKFQFNKTVFMILLSISIIWLTRIYITKDSILLPFFSIEGIYSLFRW